MAALQVPRLHRVIKTYSLLVTSLFLSLLRLLLTGEASSKKPATPVVVVGSAVAEGRAYPRKAKRRGGRQEEVEIGGRKGEIGGDATWPQD